MLLTSRHTLRALMRQRQFTYAELAETVGCSPGFLTHLTGGRRTSCTDALAVRIAEALMVPLDIVFVPVPAPTRVTCERSVA